jgi:hypothetical protein
VDALALVGFLSGGRSFDFKTPAHRSRAGPSVRVQEVSLSVNSSVFCPNAANVFLAAGEDSSAGGVYLPSVPLLTACHAPEVVVVVAVVVVAAAVRAGTLATVFVGGEFLVFQLCAVLGGEFIVAHNPEDTSAPEDIISLLLLQLGVSSRLEPINTRPEGSRVGDDPKLEMRGLSKRLLPLSILLLLGLWSGGGSFTIIKERLFSAFSRLFARAGGRLLLVGERLDDDA